MTFTDWVGTIGVTILLVAYFLNLTDKISKDGFIYLFLNFLGAAIACLASILLKYLPFIILEIVWTLVSAIGLFKSLKIRKN
ncbi:MAG: hypothetical protein Q8880_10610 [Bacteroidota bacterium]|nr:hypothetical protein [Bacteroidota bacterium]